MSTNEKDVKKSDTDCIAKPPVAHETKSPNDLVMDILIADAAARAVENEEKRENIRRKQKAREESGIENEIARAHRIGKCNHLKGGKFRPFNAVVDYAIYLHTFIDGFRRVRCTICGMDWRSGGKETPADTTRFIYREFRGQMRELPNPSQWGYAEALEALKHSSNKASSSEVPEIRSEAGNSASELQAQVVKLQAQLEAAKAGKFSHTNQ